MNGSRTGSLIYKKKAAFGQQRNSEISELENDDILRQHVGVLDGFQIGITMAVFQNLERVGVNGVDGNGFVGQADLGVGVGHIQMNVGVGLVKLFDFVLDTLNRSVHKVLLFWL